MRALAVLLVLGTGACRAPETRHHPARGALGPYSAAVEAGGLVFLAGKVAPREGPFAAEAEACFDALDEELAHLGLSGAELVSVTVYLTDMADFTALNELYARRIPAPHPARATVAVAALPARARVELVAVARVR